MFFGAVRGCVKSGGLNTHKVRFAHRAFILDGLYALYPEVLTLPFSVHIVNEMLRQIKIDRPSMQDSSGDTVQGSTRRPASKPEKVPSCQQHTCFWILQTLWRVLTTN